MAARLRSAAWKRNLPGRPANRLRHPSYRPIGPGCRRLREKNYWIALAGVWPRARGRAPPGTRHSAGGGLREAAFARWSGTRCSNTGPLPAPPRAATPPPALCFDAPAGSRGRNAHARCGAWRRYCNRADGMVPGPGPSLTRPLGSTRLRVGRRARVAVLALPQTWVPPGPETIPSALSAATVERLCKCS